jgi:hypothetical protein
MATQPVIKSSPRRRVSMSNCLFPPSVTPARVAAACVKDGQVSNSWGMGEFVGENANDKFFMAKNIVYFFSAGDIAGVSYPAASPNVVGVGGSAFSRDQIHGEFQSQASLRRRAAGGEQAAATAPTAPRCSARSSRVVDKTLVSFGRKGSDLSKGSLPRTECTVAVLHWKTLF